MRIPIREGLLVRVLTAFAAIASIAHVAVLIPRYIITDPTVPTGIRLFVATIVITVLSALAGSVLALVLVIRSWSRSGARPLALFLAAVSTLWGSILRVIDVSASADNLHISLQASSSVEILVIVAAILVAAAAFLRFSALFPAPLDPEALPPARGPRVLRRMRIALMRAPVVWSVAVLLIAATAAFISSAGPLVSLLISGSTDIESTITTNAAVRIAWFASIAAVALISLVLLPCAAMVLGVRNLIAGYRVASGDERRRVLWLVAGTVTATWMIILPLILIPLVAITTLSPDWLPFVTGLLWFLAPAVLVGSAAVAIFYTGAVDPALVLRRSTIYGIIGVVAFIAFTVLESLLSQLFEATLGLPGLAGSVAAGVVAAALMVPLRRLLPVGSVPVGGRGAVDPAELAEPLEVQPHDARTTIERERHE